MLRRVMWALPLASILLAAPTSRSETLPVPMVLVHAGTFIMGDGGGFCGTDEHEVTLTHDYYIGQYEITNQQFRDAVQWAYDHGYVTAWGPTISDNLDGSSKVLVDLTEWTCEISFADEMFTVDPGKGNRPVVAVSWYGAAAYCDWLSMRAGLSRAYNHATWYCNGGDPYTAAGYRLPTDAEWEFAAQYDDERIYPWGNEPASCSRVNFASCVGSTSAVGSYPAAPASLALYDMAGNAWEWCNDWSVCNPGTVPQTDPTGPSTGVYRILHGGTWTTSDDYLRCASRYALDPMAEFYYLGLRCARTLPGPRVLSVPAEYSSIASAFAEASPGDTILVSSGTYYEHDVVLTSGVVLISECGSDSTTVDAQQLGRVFQCVDVDSTTEIRGFTIGNGLAAPGGGMLCETSSPDISDCVFAFNTAADSHGGGMALIGSSPHLTNCVFYENEAVWGGAVYCEDSSPRMSGCTIVANSAMFGSGLYGNDGSVLSLENSIVAFGVAGEAVACAAGSNASLTCCDVYGNDGGDWVGCIAGQQGSAGNMHADPLFCSATYHMYDLYPESPCAPENNPTCGLIGALPAGCDFTRVAGADNVPRAFSLSANWPNPFNPSTSIRFALPERAVVDLTLYDTAGRRVARLASGVYEAGEHTITWNGQDDAGREVPSGIYFARLHAGEYGAVRKMVLIR